jgi:F1F0 ATPase subunit 2
MSLEVNDLVGLALAFTAGLGLGSVFFGGLWLTLRRLSASRQPGLLVLGSLVARMGIALLGFAVVTGDSWQRLVACAIGFFVVRHLMIRWLQPVNPLTLPVESREVVIHGD